MSSTKLLWETKLCLTLWRKGLVQLMDSLLILSLMPNKPNVSSSEHKKTLNYHSMMTKMLIIKSSCYHLSKAKRNHNLKRKMSLKSLRKSKMNWRKMLQGFKKNIKNWIQVLVKKQVSSPYWQSQLLKLGNSFLS